MEKKAGKNFSLIINPESPIHLSHKQSITMGHKKTTILAGEMVPENRELSNIGGTLSAESQLKD